MANVLHPHLDFHPRPVAHAPSPFGFGFGLGPSTSMSMMPSTGWGTSTPGHTNTASFHQLASSMTQSASSRPQKRRMSPDDELEHGRYSSASTSRDESMDRSPTPERPKRAAPKRARVVDPTTANTKADDNKEHKDVDSPGDNGIDIGVLLASLPPQSLLPLLLSLLKEQPALKDTILPLIPCPTAETAIQTLAQSAKELIDAFPYSNNVSTFTTASTFGSARPPSNSLFGHPPEAPQPQMRNEYILSRLRSPIIDYVSVCMSYLPYFTCIPTATQTSISILGSGQTIAATQHQALRKEKFKFAESFKFLQAVTRQILNQPCIVQTELLKLILPRLSEEWKTWAARLDQEGNGVLRLHTINDIKLWERGLDELADARNPEIASTMKDVRSRVLTKLHWMFGRRLPEAMDERQ